MKNKKLPVISREFLIFSICKIEINKYQLVILDVMLPGLDGFEILEKIREEYNLRVLMFTAKNDNISKVRGLRAGADDYVTKPFEMDELTVRIISLIPLHPL